VRAPIGAVVKLYYDAPELDLLDGATHAIRTPTGRTYVVLDARRQRRGLHVGRWHLRALVADEPPPGAVVHPLVWYKRG
jgi:hypothetical protein